jgi:hypothetical protein
MDLLATLRRSGGIDAIARQTGENPAKVAETCEPLLVEILDGMRDFVNRSGGARDGLAVLVALLDGMGNSNLAAEVMGPERVDGEAGRILLTEVCGVDDALDVLVSRAGLGGGEGEGRATLIAPLLVMLVGGYVSAIAAGTVAQIASGEQGMAGLLDLLGLPG